jgi:hypothetical protein
MALKLHLEKMAEKSMITNQKTGWCKFSILMKKRQKVKQFSEIESLVVE